MGYEDRFRFDDVMMSVTPAVPEPEQELEKEEIPPVSEQKDGRTLGEYDVNIIPEEPEEQRPVQERLEELVQREPEKKDVPVSLRVQRQEGAKRTGGRGNNMTTAVDKVPMSHVQIPRSMVQTLRQVIPDAANASEALSAYLYVTLGRNANVPEYIKSLAEGYTDDSGVADIQSQVLELQKSVKIMGDRLIEMEKLLYSLQLAQIWLVGYRLGFQVNESQSPERMDFTYPEGDMLTQRLMKQAADAKKAADTKAGRQTYQNISRYKDSIRGK